MMTPAPLTLGAISDGAGRCTFRVWAPEARAVEVHLLGPMNRWVPMEPQAGGYHFAEVDQVAAGSDYRFRLDGGKEYPDPASRWQPGGVHGPSRVLDPGFEWSDGAWRGLSLRDYVLYELHVGTFDPAGTFEGVIGRLPELKELGITAIELMPVAQFPGTRNWGYDGVYSFAVQDSYGGPQGLKNLVNAAHRQGMAVVLDVVYNHLGPEGNYLGKFGAYFTDRYRTPWGLALNFDGPQSDAVRRHFTENAWYWLGEFHIDALRLDAVHAIRDWSAVPFLEELAADCQRQAAALNRRFHLIAESDMNMARHTLPPEVGGYGLSAQWSDDFHHSLHVLLTGERDGYYMDFGGVGPFAKAWREGYVYTGEYSRHRQRRHGSNPRCNRVEQFVVCSQNHDQVGNRRMGDRLSATISFEQQKLAAGAVLLSPYIPLLFMGEEYGETAPFQYFVSHTDAALIQAVREGRRAEFAAFGWQGEIPDPQDERTFQRCRLNPGLAREGAHQALRGCYRELLRLRAQLPALIQVRKETLETVAFEAEEVVLVHQWCATDAATLIFNFATEPRSLELPVPAGDWRKRFDSSDPEWAGPGGLAMPAVSSRGRVRLDLRATGIVLYQKMAAA